MYRKAPSTINYPVVYRGLAKFTKRPISRFHFFAWSPSWWESWQTSYWPIVSPSAFVKDTLFLFFNKENYSIFLFLKKQFRFEPRPVQIASGMSAISYGHIVRFFFYLKEKIKRSKYLDEHFRDEGKIVDLLFFLCWLTLSRSDSCWSRTTNESRDL